ncbi:hypothetical protein Godav_011252, partial [Gossypium davidsonii]|nr:hypothetical protein [Gossypium davidsonii]
IIRVLIIERELATLSLDDEEDEIVEVQRQVELAVNENDFWLVGCFLTASVIHFPFMKKGFGADYYEASWMFNNHLLVFHRLFLREDPLKATFEKKEEANVCNRKLCICAMRALGVEVVKMGWDLTLKAQLRKDLSEYSQGVEFRSLGTTDGKVLEIFLYRRLPRGIPTGRNENDKLKCLRVGEPSNYAKTLVYAEVA